MGLKESVNEETVSSLPLRAVLAVKAATVVRAAVAQMRAKQLGCCVIVGHDGKPTGIFTERSVIDALVQDASLDNRTVAEFADPIYQVVNGDEPISRVWNAIVKDGFRFICVTDDDGQPIGVTGQRGLAEFVSEHFPQQIMVQRLGSKPWMQEREGA